MYIYSVTIHINKEVEQEWLNFMQTKHISDVLNAGYFTKASMRKVVHDTNEPSATYSIEYLTETIEQYEHYAQRAAPALQKDVSDRFAGKFTAQRTFYKIVSEY